MPLFPGSTTDANNPPASTSPPGGNAPQKKSVLVGKRPGLGVSSMLSQFKNYSHSKKNPVLGQRPSVFCSPDDEDEDEEDDYSKFLEMKGNSGPVFSSVSLDDSMAWTPQCIFRCLVIGILSLRVNVLIACLKSLPQWIQTPDSLSTRWPLLWPREELSWREKPRRTTKTIPFSRKFKGKRGSSGRVYFHGAFKLNSCHMMSLPFRFLYDRSTMEYLYFKNRVAVLRKNLLRPDITSDNGKTSFLPHSLFCLLLEIQKCNCQMGGQ